MPGERDANRALHDAHGDGLWRFDPDTRNVDVHVLVRQAATILDPRPGQQPATRTAAIAALTAALAAAADDIRRHPAIALEAQHARYMASTIPDPDLTADARRPAGLAGTLRLPGGPIRQRQGPVRSAPTTPAGGSWATTTPTP